MKPTLKVIYLIFVAVAVFVLPTLPWVGAVAVFQVLLWTYAGYPARQPARLVTRLLTFFTFILLSFVFFPSEGMEPDWYGIPFAAWTIEISLSGLREGALMCLRIYTVIFTSMLVRRSTSSQDFVAGLRGIFIPETIALTLDTTLHLLEPEQLKGGRGDGSGGGGHRKKGGVSVVLKQVLRGDVGFFVAKIEAGLEKARRYVGEHHGGLSAQRVTDLGVVSGITLTMLTLKWLKVLPGLPFAPGHKTVLLLPLYLLAAELTATRWGATLVGTSVGIMGFLMGDGRYGIFEVFKHIAPGVIIDFLHPLFQGKTGRIGAFGYGVIGLLAAFGRFATIVAIALIAGAPDAFYAMAAPLALVHLGFGAASGLVSYAVVHSLSKFKEAAGVDGGAPAPQGASPEESPPPKDGREADKAEV